MPAKTDEYVERALDPELTKEMATVFGNDETDSVQKVFYDHELEGTPTKAYQVSPKEIAELYGDRNLPQSLLDTTVPYIALSPDLKRMPKDLAEAIIDHEKAHAAQPKGKLALLGIYARTLFGTIPLGRMLVEGWTEYGLEKRGTKPPSRYFDEMYGKGTTAYSQFRDFVYDVEDQSPGITRQIVRAARKGGPNAAVRLIESIPNIDSIATKYATRLIQN